MMLSIDKRMCRMKTSSEHQRSTAKCLIDRISLENGPINSILAEYSTIMVLHHHVLFHILSAISSRFMKISVKKLEAWAVCVATTFK